MGLRLNSVVLGGTLGKDPEVRATAGGKKVANFSLACDTGRDGEADWFEVTAWDGTAELAEKYLKKGSQVVIEGRLSQNKWQTDDGQKRSKVVLVANRLNFVGAKAKDSGGGTAVTVSDEDIPF